MLIPTARGLSARTPPSAEKRGRYSSAQLYCDMLVTYSYYNIITIQSIIIIIIIIIIYFMFMFITITITIQCLQYFGSAAERGRSPGPCGPAGEAARAAYNMIH